MPDDTPGHASSNMWIAHTERVSLFLEVTGVEQALVQKIVATFEEAYLMDIHNRTKIQSTTPWRMCWLAFKTTTVSWCPTSSSSANKLSRRQPTILDTQSRLYSLLLKNFLSFPTSPERCIQRTNLWISHMWFFTGREISDWQLANGIAWQQSKESGLDSNSFSGQHTKNHKKHSTSPLETPGFST